MKLKITASNILTGNLLVGIMNEKDAAYLDLHPLDRIKIMKGSKIETVVLDIARGRKIIRPGFLALDDEVINTLRLKERDVVKITPARKPLSIDYIKKKLDGNKLSKKEINQIVFDIVHNKLSNIELTYFVSACYSNRMTLNETTMLTRAMTNYGDILRLKRHPVMDKHCVGGVAGNRTTPIVVSIVAAAGLTIPKTSSRSITSPAGTADTMEILTNVSLPLKKMKKVVERTNGCLVWGGALNLAPSDDKIIRVEKPLSIDAKSQLLASVLAKKASVSATHLLIDIPCGKGSKISSKIKARALKKDFENLSRRLGIKVKVIMADGSQPIGNGIGPALEARDVLYVLKNDDRAPSDLRKKSLFMAGEMLEMGRKAKKGQGHKLAKDILDSGKAFNKLLEIIKAQGKKITDPDKVKTGMFSYDVKSWKKGVIKKIGNMQISKIARIAGAPEDSGAGIYLYKCLGDKIKKGENIFTIYAHNKTKLRFAVEAYKKLDGIKIK